jgi:RimJ/RimL family protein N-acetyltransferase
VARGVSSWEQPSLYTERLRLRPPNPRDAAALYDLFADPEVVQGLNKEPISAVEDAGTIIEEMLGGWRADGLGAFILETRATPSQVVGQAGLMIFDRRGWTPSTRRRRGFTLSPSSAGP